MLQVKTGCELKLAAGSDNVNLILIWLHFHYFQQKNVKVLFWRFAKKTGAEALAKHVSLVYHHRICL